MDRQTDIHTDRHTGGDRHTNGYTDSIETDRHIETYRQNQTDRKTDKWIDREAGTQIVGCTDRYTETERQGNGCPLKQAEIGRDTDGCRDMHTETDRQTNGWMDRWTDS